MIKQNNVSAADPKTSRLQSWSAGLMFFLPGQLSIFKYPVRKNNKTFHHEYTFCEMIRKEEGTQKTWINTLIPPPNVCADPGKIEFEKSSCLAIRLFKDTLHKQAQNNLEVWYVSERGVSFEIKIFFKKKSYGWLIMTGIHWLRLPVNFDTKF